MVSRAAAVCLSISLIALAACSGNRRPDQAASQLSFGVDMARHGLWKEALFRFQEAERLDPGNPRVQSNLGVAYEAAGQFDKALSYYQKALKLDPNDKQIRTNYARFVEFYQGFKGDKTKSAGATHPAAPPAGPTLSTPPQPGTPKPPTPGTPEPSTPGDTPPPPADNRPPL